MITDGWKIPIMPEGSASEKPHVLLLEQIRRPCYYRRLQLLSLYRDTWICCAFLCLCFDNKGAFMWR